MAIEKMKMVSIVGKYDMLNTTIDHLMKSRCYQPEGAADMMAGVKGYTHISEENPYTPALSRLTEFFDRAGITPVTVETESKLTDAQINEYIDTIKNDIGEKQRRHGALSTELEKLSATIEMLSNFCTLNVDLKEVFACKFVKVRFGRIPAESYEKLKSYTSNPYVIFFPCSSDGNFYFGMYMAPTNESVEVDRIFASLFFERLHLPVEEDTPAEQVRLLSERKTQLENEIKELADSVKSYFDERHDDCMSLYTQLKMGSDAFDIRKYGAKYGDSFMLLGWVPEDSTDIIKQQLDVVDSIEYKIDEPQNIGKVLPPVKLKNPKIFKPFEFLVGIYGLPDYNEMDPTKFVAVTYTLLFGLMFADVGQGLVVALIGYLMWKLKKMPLGRILVPCGIMSSIFGLLFGSVFGNEELLEPVYHAIGLHGKPFDIMESVNDVIVFAIYIGIAMLLLAMLLNIYSSIKVKDWGSAFFGQNGVAGMVLYSSLVLIVYTMFVPIKLPVTLIVLCGIVLPLVLILFSEPLGHLIARKKDWKPESWGEYFLEHVFELFEVALSYLSNTLSFLRVGAFVLIHAVLMMVFYNVAGMVGNPVVSLIIIVFGNAFVIALEGLLVGIQVLRLEFYEMFSRFYNGAGKAFQPVS